MDLHDLAVRQGGEDGFHLTMEDLRKTHAAKERLSAQAGKGEAIGEAGKSSLSAEKQLRQNREHRLCSCPPASRLKLTQNIPCKSDAAEVGLAFEAVESFTDDDLNGCHFIVGQLLKFAFASLAA